jgi:hypothetical protein
LNWFKHSQPFDLKITGQEIVDEYPRGSTYGKKFMDAVMRTMTTAHDKQYLGNTKRETHYMAFSWAVSSNAVAQLKLFYISIYGTVYQIHFNPWH